jgi:hypothetical protein
VSRTNATNRTTIAAENENTSKKAIDCLHDLPPHLPGLVDLFSSKVGTEMAADVSTDLILSELGLSHPIAALVGVIVGFGVREYYVPPSPAEISLGRVLVPGSDLYGTPTLGDYRRSAPLLGF